jgi:hypothetical protein
MITRKEYKAARRFIRDNGYAVIHWLSPSEQITFGHLRIIQNEKDKLAERQSIIAWCKRESISYNFRHLANYSKY